MPENSNGSVKSILKDGVNTISFFHPAQNSLPAQLLDQLCIEIEKAGDDANANIIVLKSEGDRTFCAGASFDELLQIKDKAAGAEFFWVLQRSSMHAVNRRRSLLHVCKVRLLGGE